MKLPTNAPRKPLPPYVPYRTLGNVIENISAVGMPSHIDRNVIGSLSGGMQSWLKSSMRYMKLIDEDDVPQDNLRRLVEAKGEERKPLLRRLFNDTYSFLEGRIDLSTTTPSKLKAAFGELGAQGETIEKMVAFLVAFGKDAGVPLSPYLTKRAPSVRRPRTKPTRVIDTEGNVINLDGDGQNDREQPAQTPEQMLFALLDPETMSAEETAAVWTLLLYVKKRPA